MRAGFRTNREDGTLKVQLRNPNGATHSTAPSGFHLSGAQSLLQEPKPQPAKHIRRIVQTFHARTRFSLLTQLAGTDESTNDWQILA
jgi:hypothetical protein